MEAIFQRHLGGREVHVVGRDDGDEVHALAGRQLGLGFNHFLKGAVATGGREEEVRAGSLGAFRVRGKRAADKFHLLIHRRRDAMHPADESPASAAHHAVTNFPVRNILTHKAVLCLCRLPCVPAKL